MNEYVYYLPEIDQFYVRRGRGAIPSYSCDVDSFYLPYVAYRKERYHWFKRIYICKL